MAASKLLRSFSSDGARGTTFFEASNFPHKDKLLHKQLLEGECPTAVELQNSIGNPPPNTAPFNVYAKEMIKSEDDWTTSMTTTFQAWNNPELSVKDRFQLLHEKKVVAALGVYNPKGGPMAISVVANPVVTIPDAANVANHGAPRWDTIFTTDFAKQYVDDPTVPTHCVVASLNGLSRGPLPDKRKTFMEASLPVVLTGGEFIGTKPNNGDIFSWLLLPDGCCPPVGLIWPTSTTYTDFVSSLEHRNGGIYKGFVNLLHKEKDRFQAWFTAVNSAAAPFSVTVTSALPLWNTFFTKDHPTDEAVLDEDNLAPFRIQRERFLDSLLIDWALYSKCRGRANKQLERVQFATWLKRADECYPTELDLAVEVSRRPFIVHFFPPEPEWPIPDLVPLFTFDEDWDIPQPFAEYDGLLISLSPKGWEAVRMTRSEGGVSLEDYNQVFAQVPTVTTTNATGTPTTPGNGGLGTNTITPSPLGGGTTTTVGNVSFQNYGQNLLAQFGQQTPTTQGTPGTLNQTAMVTPGQTQQGNNPFAPGNGVGLRANASPSPFGGNGTPSGQGTNPFTSGTGTPNPFQGSLGSGQVGMMGNAMNPWATIAAMGGIPGAAHMLSTVKNQRYALMQHAKIHTAQDRQTCNPVLLQAALLLSQPTSQPFYFSSGQVVSNTEWMEVMEPTTIGKVMLTPHDHGYKGGDEIVIHLRDAMVYRCSISHDDFSGVPFPQSVTRTVLPASVQKAMYSVSSWEVGKHRKAPTMASKKWHPFHLLPLLNPSFPTEVLPHEGLDLHVAQQFGKLLYYMMAMIGAGSNDKGYDDSSFARSFFGYVLRYICTVPQNQDLTEVWRTYPRNCTQQWMEDICATFELVHGMVTFRAGADYRNLGITDAHQAMNPHLTALVAPTMMGVQNFSRSTISYVDSMNRLLQQFQQKWGNGIDAYAPKWRAPVTSAFYATTKGIPTFGLDPGLDQGSGLPPPNANTPRKPKRQRTNGVRHTNTKPLFVCTAPVPENGNPFDDVIHKAMKPGDSPLIWHPDGKSRNPICLRSAFEGYNTCAVTGICQSPFPSRSRSVGRERLHVDLSDACWSREKYKEENWKPVVDFINRFKDLIGPSRWLKEMTPNTQWAPHTPPSHIKNRWPGTFDPQYFPQDERDPTFVDIVAWVQESGFLDEINEEKLTIVHPDFVPGSLVLPFWVSKPWQPMRRRLWGFGKESKERKCTHDKVNPLSVIHHVWRLLSPAARRQSLKTFPQWRKYADLRRFASTHSLAPLKQKRILGPHETVPERLDPHRAKLNSAGLLRFDFLHGDFLRYLGGEYTNRHRDFNAEWDVIERQLENREAPSDFPPVKMDICYNLHTQGAPLRCDYVTPMSATILREAYDNHPAVDANLDTVMK